MNYSRVSAKEKIQRIERALDYLSAHETRCSICPQACSANRKMGEQGFCQSGSHVSLSHALLHFGEEPVLSGQDEEDDRPQGIQKRGSGTLFFSGCNLKCLHCQNYQLSWLNQGHILSPDELAEKILDLQEQGALNINLVSAMHMLFPLLKGLKRAYEKGFHLPIVHNTNAYERPETLKHLEGIVDIYLPDLKYHSSRASGKYSSKPDYFQYASLAIKEMHRQRPELILDKNGAAQEGLIIRHLVLPGMVQDSHQILAWIAENISLSAGLSLMSQYVPCFKAPSEIDRKVTSGEYQQVVDRALELGFETMFIQPEGFGLDEHLVPDFDRKNPFDWSSIAKD